MNQATTGCGDDQDHQQQDQQDQQQQNLSEEELRKLLKPDPSWENDILPIVLKYYSHVVAGVSGSDGDGGSDVDIRLVKQLDSYDDCNFWITIDGTNYLLKVHNGVESRDLLKYVEGGQSQDNSNNKMINKSVLWLQNEIMETLTKNGIGTNRPIRPKLPVAGSSSSASASASASSSTSTSSCSCILPIPGVSTNLPVVSREHSPTRLVVRLLGWVDGRPMSDFPMVPVEAIADAGKFLGRLSKVLSTKLKLPATTTTTTSTSTSTDTPSGAAHQRYHQWDGKNTIDLKDFVHHVDDFKKRSMVESVIDEFQSQLVDTDIAHTNFTKSLIHGDFNDANFLLDNDTFHVSGVIDFGDSVERYVCSRDFVC
mmetsp:Transcript_13312/g.32517  ORF Transcript_13312/g.32517 Transcript_13312/m.32517 type:complete len:369 (-) Transcript_13312:2273-3379(-)